jgi:ATP-dependent Clp protease ATP-binding subunit ClpA
VIVKILLHIRRDVGGRSVVTPVEFPHLAADGSSYEAARRRVTQKLNAFLDDLAPHFRHRLREARIARLAEVSVTRPATESNDAVDVTVGLVVVEVARPKATTYIAHAPAIPEFSPSSAKTFDELTARATKQLAKKFASLPIQYVMTLHETGQVDLETLEIDLPEQPGDQMPAKGSMRPPASSPPPAELLKMAGIELTASTAAHRKVAGLEIREALVQRILAALATPGHSSVVLVGRPDVGKTALTYEVADRISRGDVPPGLRGRPLWRIGANELIAGAMFTGMWQARGQALLEIGRAERMIFAMGEPEAIIGAGQSWQHDNNLSRMFRPYMETGELTLICECTEEALAAARKQEPSFINAFHRIDVPDASPHETQQILGHVARTIASAQQMEIEPAALDAAVDLTRRFEPYRALPGKSVRLLEETARSAAASKVQRIGRSEVVQSFAERTGLPLAILSDDVPLTARQVTDYLTARVLGQPEAVEAIVGIVMVIKAELHRAQKPLATLLFVGPTGVGKTELAKAVAEFLFGSRERVLRLDMAEYATYDAIQRLTGTTWSREGEGELIRRIRDQPFSVVLLDEIEKAHPMVYDALLGVMGEGRLSDARGMTADFSNAIVIMTSNLGATKSRSGSLGFSTTGHAADERSRVRKLYVDQVEKFFRPEFFNRIDRVVAFRQLDRNTVLKIARRELGHLLVREGIVRRGLLVEFDNDVVERLAETGFHPRYGARPLQREIERAVIQPLARLLVESRPKAGDLVRVSRAGEGVEIELQRIEEAPARPVRRVREAEPAAAPSLAHEAARAEKIHSRVLAAISSENGPYLYAERSRLLAETSDPEFWDQPPEARQSMSRLYMVQRLIDELEDLRDRAEGLVELGRQIRSARNRDRLHELRKALTEVEAGLRRVTLEIAAARSAAGPESAAVQIVPIGSSTTEWADQLVQMYTAWAERSGREVEKGADARHNLVIRGPASAALLAGEVGLHRRIAGLEGEALARVMVNSVNGSTGPAATVRDSHRASVVRVYDLSRRYVRDPRTGVQVKDPKTVLSEGRIDAFILAALNSRR